MERIVSMLGLVAMVGVAWLLSAHKRRVPWRVVAGGLLLQFALAVVILRTRPGQRVFRLIGDFFTGLLDYVDAGSAFVFGTGFGEHFVAFKVLPYLPTRCVGLPTSGPLASSWVASAGWPRSASPTWRA